MADDKIITIAEKLTKDLNEQSFSHEFTATRVYLPDWDRGEPGLRVIVFPVTENVEVLTRQGITKHQYVLQIGIQDESEPSEISKLDSLMGLVKEILLYLEQTTLIEGLSLTGVGREPLYDPDHLLEHHQFRTAPTLTYSGSKDI